MIATSATGGRGVAKVLERAIDLADRRSERIATPELNRFVNEVVATRPPPQKRGKRLRLYYTAQISTRPPRFAIQVNDRQLITRDWAYFLENRMREHYKLEGVPLVVDFVPKRRRARRGDGAACKTRSVRQPSAEGIRAAITRRLNSVRYAVGDVFYVIGRFLLSAGRLLIRVLVAIRRGAARFWGSLSVIARRRLIAALGVAVLLVILFSAVVPNLPCQLPAATAARPPTMLPSWCRATRWPTCTPTSTPTATNTRRPPSSPAGCRSSAAS